MAKKEKNQEIKNLQIGKSMTGRTGGIITGQNVSPVAEVHYGEESGSLTDITDEGEFSRRKSERRDGEED